MKKIVLCQVCNVDDYQYYQMLLNENIPKGESL